MREAASIALERVAERATDAARPQEHLLGPGCGIVPVAQRPKAHHIDWTTGSLACPRYPDSPNNCSVVLSSE